MSIGGFGPDFDLEFEEDLYRVTNKAGNSVSVMGIWTTGFLELEGPTHGYALHSRFQEFNEKAGRSNTKYQSMRTTLSRLTIIGVTQRISTEAAEARGLVVEPSGPTPDSGNYSERSYYIVGDIDTSWVYDGIRTNSNVGMNHTKVVNLPRRVSSSFTVYRLYKYLEEIGDVSEEELRQFITSRQEDASRDLVNWPEGVSFSDIAGEPLEVAKTRVLPSVAQD